MKKEALFRPSSSDSRRPKWHRELCCEEIDSLSALRLEIFFVCRRKWDSSVSLYWFWRRREVIDSFVFLGWIENTVLQSRKPRWGWADCSSEWKCANVTCRERGQLKRILVCRARHIERNFPPFYSTKRSMPVATMRFPKMSEKVKLPTGHTHKALAVAVHRQQKGLLLGAHVRWAKILAKCGTSATFLNFSFLLF